MSNWSGWSDMDASAAVPGYLYGEQGRESYSDVPGPDRIEAGHAEYTQEEWDAWRAERAARA